MNLASSPARFIALALVAMLQSLRSGAQQQPMASQPNVAAVLPKEPSPATQQTKPAATPLAYLQTSAFPTSAQRRNAYVYDLLGPGAFVGPAVTAGFDQARNLKVAYPPDGFPGPGLHPAHGAVPEWGEGFSGYSKRFASNFGISLVGTTARYGLGEVLREDVTYHRCTCTGLLPRTSHALGKAFIAHTRGGRSVPSLPALASPYIASEIAVASWYPSRFNASDALRISAPLYIGVPLKNLVAEFLGR